MSFPGDFFGEVTACALGVVMWGTSPFPLKPGPFPMSECRSVGASLLIGAVCTLNIAGANFWVIFVFETAMQAEMTGAHVL